MRSPLFSIVLPPRFNPTLVRLARHYRIADPDLSDGFNPTLVRLAPCWGGEGRARSPSFQSHPGSISTIIKKCVLNDDSAVSIPPWFD